jgi:hypothetical protein
MQGDAPCTIVLSFDKGTVKDSLGAGFYGEAGGLEPR